MRGTDYLIGGKKLWEMEAPHLIEGDIGCPDHVRSDFDSGRGLGTRDHQPPPVSPFHPSPCGRPGGPIGGDRCQKGPPGRLSGIDHGPASHLLRGRAAD